jgi:probable HAF family extracellular repeat protein
MWSTVQGINNAGKMVGGYWDSNWNLHAFLAEIQK